MATKTIMLNCAAGMSTSLLVKKMQELTRQGLRNKLKMAKLKDTAETLKQEAENQQSRE